MNYIKEYVEFTRTTAVYPKEFAHTYLGLAVNDEIGELVEKLQPYAANVMSAPVIDNHATVNRIGKYVLAEAGDVMYYITRCCDEYDCDLEDVIRKADYIGDATIPAALLTLVVAGSRIAGREKKQLRDGATWNEQKQVDNLRIIMACLSDAYASLAVICRFFGYTMEHVMFCNREKLQDRKDRGVIKGDGDNR